MGAVSPEMIKALETLGIKVNALSLREPIQVQETDLANADKIIAVDEVAHRPLVNNKFPQWVDNVEYWLVKDLNENPSEPPLVQLQNKINRLLKSLA